MFYGATNEILQQTSSGQYLRAAAKGGDKTVRQAAELCKPRADSANKRSVLFLPKCGVSNETQSTETKYDDQRNWGISSGSFPLPMNEAAAMLWTPSCNWAILKTKPGTERVEFSIQHTALARDRGGPQHHPCTASTIPALPGQTRRNLSLLHLWTSLYSYSKGKKKLFKFLHPQTQLKSKSLLKIKPFLKEHQRATRKPPCHTLVTTHGTDEQTAGTRGDTLLKPSHFLTLMGCCKDIKADKTKTLITEHLLENHL